MPDLERELRALGGLVEYPATPDLARAEVGRRREVDAPAELDESDLELRHTLPPRCARAGARAHAKAVT